MGKFPEIKQPADGPVHWYHVDVDDMSRSIHVGKAYVGREPKEDPPDSDTSLRNPWRVGGACNH